MIAMMFLIANLQLMSDFPTITKMGAALILCAMFLDLIGGLFESNVTKLRRKVYGDISGPFDTVIGFLTMVYILLTVYMLITLIFFYKP